MSKKFKVGVVLLVLQALAYIFVLSRGNTEDLFNWSETPGLIGIGGFVNEIIGFNLIGIAGIILALVGRNRRVTHKKAGQAQQADCDAENCVELLSQIQSGTGPELEQPSRKSPGKLLVFCCAFASCVAVIMVAFSIKQHLELKSAQSAFSELQTKMSDLAKEYERLENNYDQVRSARDSAIKTREWMKEELDFWQHYAVIVTEYGEKYHTYGCNYIEGNTFWIFNIDAAKSKGYTPCSVCNPPMR